MRNQKPCIRCGKKFNQMSSLKYHLLEMKKKPCEVKYIDLSGEEIMKDYYTHLKTYNKICNKPTLKAKESSKLKFIKKKTEPSKPRINNLIKNLKGIDEELDKKPKITLKKHLEQKVKSGNKVKSKSESKSFPDEMTTLIKNIVNHIQQHKVQFLTHDEIAIEDNINYNNIDITYNSSDPNKSIITYKTINKSKFNIAKITININ